MDRSLFLAEFKIESPSPEFELAVQYHVDCELYDRTVCTGLAGRDGAMPGNPGELAKINMNAHAKRRQLREKAERSGWNPSEFGRLIHNNAVIDEAIRRLKGTTK